MRKEVERGLDKELDRFIEDLYAPINDRIGTHLQVARTGAYTPDLNISAPQLNEMYSENGVIEKAEQILKEKAAGLSAEAQELARNVVWLSRYGSDKAKPKNDYVECGPDRLTAYEDRKFEGIKIKFGSDAEGAPTPLSIDTVETFSSKSEFVLAEAAGFGQTRRWLLQSGTLNVGEGKGNQRTFSLNCTRGETHSMMGTTYKVEAIEKVDDLEFPAATWIDRIDEQRTPYAQRTLRLTNVHNVKSPSGKWFIDVAASSSTGYEFEVGVSKSRISRKTKLENSLSRGMNFGSGFSGAVFGDGEGGESYNGVTACVDNQHPIGQVVITETTTDFKKGKNRGTATKETKRVEMSPVRINIITSNDRTPAKMSWFRDSLKSVFAPIAKTLSEASK